jgi:uncharacterized protein (TIGR00255 family)
MTGFGAGSSDLPGGGRLVVELRAVNHRFLDVRVRAPADQPDLGALVEDLVRKSLGRGRVESAVRLEGWNAPPVTLDVARAKAAFTALEALRDELAPGEPVPLSLLAAVPDLFASHRPRVDPDALRSAAGEAFAAAAAALQEMRAQEGASLARDLGDRLARVEALVSALQAEADQVVDAWHARLRERVARLLDGSDVPVDEARLAQELATLAERSDVAEELTRLASHCAQFRQAMDQGGAAPVGRRLDFLLQEMNREANTIGSKSVEARLAHRVVDLKAELERLREQVQNVL